MEQLCLKGLLESTVGPTVAFDETTMEEVVALMAEAIRAVLQEGGGYADDEPCPQP